MKKYNKNANKFIKLLHMSVCASMLLYCIPSNAEDFEVDDRSLFVPTRLGKISVIHNEEGFYIQKNNIRHEVKNYWLDPSLRDASSERLGAFLKHGYLSVNQLDDEEFTIKAQARGLGGGPVLGILAGLGTCVGVVGCALVGNVPGALGLIYAAPAIIAGGIVAPTP